MLSGKHKGEVLGLFRCCSPRALVGQQFFLKTNGSSPVESPDSEGPNTCIFWLDLWVDHLNLGGWIYSIQAGPGRSCEFPKKQPHVAINNSESHLGHHILGTGSGWFTNILGAIRSSPNNPIASYE